jgi:hypothetical protein
MNSQFASYTTICLHKEKLNQRGAYESQLDVKDGKILLALPCNLEYSYPLGMLTLGSPCCKTFFYVIMSQPLILMAVFCANLAGSLSKRSPDWGGYSGPWIEAAVKGLCGS